MAHRKYVDEALAALRRLRDLKGEMYAGTFVSPECLQGLGHIERAIAEIKQAQRCFAAPTDVPVPDHLLTAILQLEREGLLKR